MSASSSAWRRWFYAVRGLWARPRRLRIEASTACQLRCPLCPTARGRVGQNLGTGFLQPAALRGLLNDSPQIRRLELSNFGEALLHPQLPELLRIAWSRGVKVSFSNGVNFNRATPELLQALVEFQVERLTCSIDGATQETYARYRVRGDLSQVLNHLRSLRQLQQQMGSPYPQLTWQFVEFDHNRHEIPLARELAAELGMKFRLKPNWSSTGSIDASASPALHHQHCRQLWVDPQINFDGRLLGCCVNYWGDFGPNVFEVGLEAALNHPRMRAARRTVMGLQAPTPDLPCATCPAYRSMKENQSWVQPAEVYPPGWRRRLQQLAHAWESSYKM